MIRTCWTYVPVLWMVGTAPGFPPVPVRGHRSDPREPTVPAPPPRLYTKWGRREGRSPGAPRPPPPPPQQGDLQQAVMCPHPHRSEPPPTGHQPPPHMYVSNIYLLTPDIVQNEKKSLWNSQVFSSFVIWPLSIISATDSDLWPCSKDIMSRLKLLMGNEIGLFLEQTDGQTVHKHYICVPT